MSEYQEALFICVVVGTVTFLIPWLHRKYAYNRDSAKIVAFLRDSKYTFRSIDAIAEGTGLEAGKVENICLHDGRIIQNRKRPDTWRVL